MSWPRNPGFKSGDYKQICDICGFIILASTSRKRWDGLTTCQKCWDPRHPQELRVTPNDNQSVPDPNPESADTFLNPGDVTPSDL